MTVNPLRENVCFILVRPVYLGNIGSIARVLKNFGFVNLRLVGPPANYKDSEARRMSVGAFDVLKKAQVFETLGDSLKDINIALGTTSGQQRELEPRSLKSISDWVIGASAANRIAFVLGDERNGLSRAELERCHQVIHIPTQPDFAALNVAQAAAIISYELSRAQDAGQSSAASFSSGRQDDEIFLLLDQLLEKVEFSRKFNRVSILSELRGFYQRALPTSRECDLLSGALHRLNQKLQDA